MAMGNFENVTPLAWVLVVALFCLFLTATQISNGKK